MSRSTAWMLDFGEGLTAAVGSAELAHVVADPALFAIPQTPPHCNRAMIWRGRALPVMDLSRWIKGRGLPRERLYAGIVAYECPEKTDKSAEFAALLLSAIPVRHDVDDEDARPLPAEPAAWSKVSWSCFREGPRVYPILALSRIFSGTLNKVVEKHEDD